MGTFTIATPTTAAFLNGLTTTPALSADDSSQRRLAAFFTLDGNAYWGYVNGFTAPSTVYLASGVGLPTEDLTDVCALMVFDTYDNAHDYQDYLDEIASLIQDNAGKLSAADIGSILTKAVTDSGKDMPLLVKKKITGADTALYNLQTMLGSNWKAGYSQLFSIEYPTGSNPAQLLPEDDYAIYDDGTAQDYSNLALQFIENEPSTIENFVVEFSIEPVLPSTGQSNFPDTNKTFSIITTLAAAYACQRLATLHAQNEDATIQADVINYNNKSSKYSTLANQYFTRYNVLVFGQEKPVSDTVGSMSLKPMSPSFNTEGIAYPFVSPSFLFHRRRH